MSPLLIGIIKSIIAAIVLFVIGWALNVVVLTVGLPAVITTLIAVVLVLIWAGYVMKVFGISF